MQRLLLSLFLFFPSFLFGQSVLTYELNMLRDGDELKRFRLRHTALSQRGTNAVWDLSDKGVQPVKYRHRYAAVPDTSLLSCVERDTRYYYDCRGDSLLLLGFENNQTKLSYTRPISFLRFPFQYGDSIGGLYEARGTYCDRETLHGKGRYKSVADGTGVLILPDGDTLRNVLRVRTYCSGTDRLSLRADSMKHSGKSIRVVRETLRWYAPGYRYPILEVRNIRSLSSDGSRYTSAFYCPPEEQEYLPLDEANRKVREELRYGDDGEKTTGGMQQENITYRVSNDREARRLRVDYELQESASLEFILADSRGIVHRTLSRNDAAGTGYTADISCGGLMRGQYVLYICVNGIRHAEKFNVQ